MPDEVVCDSSVAVRWFLDQDGHDAARRLLERAASGELVLLAPPVILWETGNVLLKRGVRAGILTVADPVDAVNAVRDMCRLIEVDPGQVGALAFELGTSYFDAAFASVALERRLMVVTADVRFARAVAGRVSTDVPAGVGLST